MSYIHFLLCTSVYVLHFTKVKFEENWQIFKRSKMDIFTVFPHSTSSSCGAIMCHTGTPWEAETERTELVDTTEYY